MSGAVIPFERRAHRDPRVVEIEERLARCRYMLQRHQEGILLNARRIDALLAELASLSTRRRA